MVTRILGPYVLGSLVLAILSMPSNDVEAAINVRVVLAPEPPAVVQPQPKPLPAVTREEKLARRRFAKRADDLAVQYFHPYNVRRTINELIRNRGFTSEQAHRHVDDIHDRVKVSIWRLRLMSEGYSQQQIRTLVASRAAADQDREPWNGAFAF